jgi:mono/diheme cytochrome c family protein
MRQSEHGHGERLAAIRRSLIGCGAAILSLSLVPIAKAQQAPPTGAELYVERCAACHGANLEGQPDWMVRKPDGKLPAPPHDASGHTWHHSDKQLLAIVGDGLGAIAPGYETDVPAFGDQLTDAEILAILDYIKSRWPERERAYQAARSAADPNPLTLPR